MKPVRGRKDAEELAMSAHHIARECPLSFAQEHLLIMHQLARGSAVYHLTAAFRLEGTLDIAVLLRAATEIMWRHEALRTCFPNRKLAEVTFPSLPAETYDLCKLPEEIRNAEAYRIIADCAGRSFEVTQGPLWRIYLVKPAESDHFLGLTMHHLISDGSSIEIFLRELSVVYNAYQAALPMPLREMPLPYSSFALWQRRQIEQGFLQNSVSFWAERLQTDVTDLRLPEDFPAPNIPDYAGGREPLAIPRSLAERLREVSKRERVTLFVTLLALFQSLLRRHTGQNDIIICLPFAGRSRIESQGVIGYFNNILPIRMSLDENLSFRELLSRTRREVLALSEHANLPFHVIAALANSASIASTNTRISLTRAMFEFSSTPVRPLEFAGVTAIPLDVHNGTSNFDLCATLQDRAGTLSGSFKYKARLFRAATIQRMARDFETMMEVCG